MIFEHQNKKYILETHLKGDTDHMGYYDKGGVNIYELRNRINMYEGYNFFLKLNDNNRIFDLHKKIPIYKNISFNDKYKKHFLEYCLPKKYVKLVLHQCIRKVCFVHNLLEIF